MQVQMNAFEDAFNINSKNIPQIKLNHNGTVFIDKKGYEWKVGFTYKNMTIFCDKCLKLATRTSYCQPVKDCILRLQQAAPHPSSKEKKTTSTPLSLPAQMQLIGNAAPLMCTCIGTFRGNKNKMATKDQVEDKMDEIRRRKHARLEATSSHEAMQDTA